MSQRGARNFRIFLTRWFACVTPGLDISKLLAETDSAEIAWPAGGE
jgi:hypothetical protein